MKTLNIALIYLKSRYLFFISFTYSLLKSKSLLIATSFLSTSKAATRLVSHGSQTIFFSSIPTLLKHEIEDLKTNFKLTVTRPITI